MNHIPPPPMDIPPPPGSERDANVDQKATVSQGIPEYQPSPVTAMEIKASFTMALRDGESPIDIISGYKEFVKDLEAFCEAYGAIKSGFSVSINGKEVEDTNGIYQ